MIEFKPLYISMIKNITNNELINSVRERDGKKQLMTYHLIQKYLLEQIELNKYSNPKSLNFDNHFIDLLKIEYVDIEINDLMFDLDIDIWDE